MSLRGKTAVIGVYEHPARYAPHLTPYQIMAESARGALEDAGLTIGDIDGLCTAGVGPLGVLALANHLNLHPTYLDSTNLGGSSFVAHVAHASAAIAAGLCNTALVLYGSTAASERFAVGTGGSGAFGDPPDAYETAYGPTVVGGYAMAAMRHMHEFGTRAEQLAEIAVTTRRHASLNPAAKYRDPIAIEDVLASRLVSAPLHLLDCCMISDGGGALVVTSAERARDAKKKAAYVLGAAEAVSHTGIGRADVLEVAAAQSGKKAMAMAGVSHRDIDLCMIYDSFTITVLLTLENLGFCKRGEGGAFVSGGRLAFDGPCPTNTDGGGLSSNHPGMRGIFLVIEAVKQLRGEAALRQVKKRSVALCHGTGGVISRRHSGATLVLSSSV
ncbi:MAG TPA: acetyl-CoA acetyltransferase [Candidatus Binatia bacterium]|nr:acetyl-CoA acetyltransferase [Candidatus Binatia bacterium]